MHREAGSWRPGAKPHKLDLLQPEKNNLSSGTRGCLPLVEYVVHLTQEF